MSATAALAQALHGRETMPSGSCSRRCPLPGASGGAGRRSVMVCWAWAVTRSAPDYDAQRRRPGSTVVGMVSEGGSQVLREAKIHKRTTVGERIITLVRIG